jgi:hypothetical protein
MEAKINVTGHLSNYFVTLDLVPGADTISAVARRDLYLLK